MSGSPRSSRTTSIRCGIHGEQRRPALGAAHDVVAALLEHEFERPTDRLVVLDDQYAHRLHAPMLSAAERSRWFRLAFTFARGAVKLGCLR